MKCANCGAELKVGCMYCSVCGKEAQIVSDYNLLEDDFLRDVLKEQEEKVRKEVSGQSVHNENIEGKTSQENHTKMPQEQSVKKSPQKRRIKKRLIFAVLAMVLLIVLSVSSVLMINYSRDNSYDYQMERAQNYLEDRNYREAENRVKRALELNEDSVEAKIFLADIYVLRGEEDKAVKILEEVCKEQRNNKNAYQKLIELYAAQKDYQALQTLSEQAADSEVSELFSEYFPKAPEFDTEEGIYTEELSVGISTEDECRIYYTLDGTDPRQGAEYQNPIPIVAGEMIQIRAIARNDYGLYGDEVQGEFQVELQKPQKPRVSPSGGSFYEAQNIAVTVPEGCKVYYTWDGTTPGTGSAQYTQPITMPEGNNILSLIAVNEHGMSSDVLKCNYIYMPATANTPNTETEPE